MAKREDAMPEWLSETEGSPDVGYALPVSLVQERLLLLAQRHPDDPAWNAAVQFKVTGPLDLAVLNSALNILFARHETLRTRFDQRGGAWVQLVDPPQRYELAVVDLLDWPDEQRQAEADRISTSDARFPFDLAQGPLFRFKLLHVGEREHRLLITFHLAVADLWSIGILTRELGVLYAAFSQGAPSPLVEPPLQYGDYCIWERENGTASHLPAESAFWKAQLHDLPSLDVPVDTPNGAPSSAARTLSQLLPIELTDRAQELAVSEGTTIFNMMFAAACVVFHRYSGQTAFGIGTQVANRFPEEMEHVVGPLVNTIVLRADLHGQPTFREFLSRIHDMVAVASSQARLRWEEVIRAARPGDYPVCHGLLRVNFVCQRSLRPVQFSGISLASVPSNSTGALYDLNLFLIQRDEGWRMSCEFRTDLFADKTIETLLESYRATLEEIVRQPEVLISNFSSLRRSGRPSDRSEAQQVENKLPASARFVVPVSSSQERIWFNEQLLPGNVSYNLPASFRIHGALSIDVLQRTLDEIVRRHESLRTTFTMVEDNVRQVIHAPAPASLRVIDLAWIPTGERWAAVRDRAREEVQRPFNLLNGPLFRAAVYCLPDNDWFLVLVLHHIVGDGWSLRILTREFEQIYSAFAANLPSPVPEPQLQYVDYVHWQRSWYQTAAYRSELAYWIRRSQDAPPALPLPADFPYRPDRGNSGEVELLYIPEDIALGIRKYCAREGITFFMFSLAAFYVLLNRYSGACDIAVGTPTANRSQPDLESTIGYFVDTLVLRARFDPCQPFSALLRTVREVTTDAFDHQHVPFDEIVRAIKADRSTGRHPIYQVLFSYQKAFIHTPRLPGLEIEHEFVSRSSALVEMWFALIDRPEGLRMTVEYSTELFHRDTILRMCGHYREILAGLSRNVDQAVSTVPMLTQAERRLILDEWNATARRYPAVCVHDLFEEQVRLNPDAVALVFCGEAMTYGELNDKADRLAAALRARCVEPGRLVALCVERSFDMVVGVLGVFKAGGAYVPIDPAYPADRIAFVLEDSKADVVVTQRALLESLPSIGSNWVVIDDLEPPPSVTFASTARPGPSDLAYVIYTSGSTGRPKGVQIPHRAVVNFLNSMRREPGLAASDTLLAVTTLSFDIAGLELYLPLSTGARVVIASREVASDGEALLAEIREHGVTILQATPVTWRLLLAAGWTGTPGLKALCGGEAMPPDLAAQLIPRCAELWNMYGPTETTIWSTCARITNSSDIHIGRPIDNTSIYIFDENRQPQPIGIPGEMLIGGDGLAVGYLNRPSLTAERFIPHPFHDGKRLYRTGDLAKYRKDGTIDCLGRLDFQVKIRGFRVELGEIEAHIADFQGIAQNAVAAREDTPGDTRLVAYLICPQGPPSIEELRNHLHSRLPDYMIPSAFVLLDSLPITPNGKVDRRALPAPEANSSLALESAVPPRNSTEQKLTAIFAEVLGRPVTSVTASFFDMGGHSLVAVRLMSRIEREFGRHLPLALLFKAPSVADLAVQLTTTETGEAWSSLVPIRPQAGKPNLYLVHGAGGNLLLYNHLARALAPDISLHGFQSLNLDGSRRPVETVEEMAHWYVRELRAFQPSGPYHIGGYCMGGSVAFEMARLLLDEGQTVGLVILLDSYNLATVKHARTRHSQMSIVRQKATFHLGNLAHLNAREAAAYLSEKVRIAAENSGLDIFSPGASRKSGPVDGVQRRAQEVNHEAGWNFVPRPSPVHLTIFRPSKNYDFLPDPKLGWGPVVGDLLDVIVLPTNPHAMLVDPIVGMVAAEIKTRMLASVAIHADR